MQPQPYTPIICAHRGGGGTNRITWENQLATFAVSECQAWELDVWLSKDRVPVVNHDGNLKRTHGIDKAIEEFTADELRRESPPVATLDEILDLAESRKGQHTLFIELKGGDIIRQRMYSTYATPPSVIPERTKYTCLIEESDLTLARTVARMVQARVQSRKWSPGQLPVIGFIHEQLEEAQKTNPQLMIGYSFSRESFGYNEREMNENAETHGQARVEQMIAITNTRSNGKALSINPDYRYVNKAFVQKAHACNLQVNVWTPNSLETIKAMIAAKADTIITDVPMLAYQALEEYTGRKRG